MKKSTILLAGAILIAGFSAPALAATKKPATSAGILRCALWLVPGAYCSAQDTLIGGALMGAAIGTGIGSIWAGAWQGAVIGGTTGVIAPFVLR